MLNSPSVDEAQYVIRERHAWAEHQALVQYASAVARASRGPSVAPLSPLRNRVAAALRSLACRLDPAVCLEWT